MEIGDKRKATTLAVVAVAALAFLVYRLLPTGPGHVQVAADRTPVSAPAASDKPLPLTLVADPFTHPALARQGEDKASKADSVRQPRRVRGALPAAKPNGAAELGFGSDSKGADDSSDRTADSGNGKGMSLAPAQPPGHTLLLTAIMSVDKFQAIIKVDDKPQVFEVGARVMRGVSIKSITPDAVVLSVDGKKKTLKPGAKANIQ